jgi:hypothetical protein
MRLGGGWVAVHKQCRVDALVRSTISACEQCPASGQMDPACHLVGLAQVFLWAQEGW